MADNASSGGELKPTLGLTGVTINAMALIAPGAFLWTTFQEQSAYGTMSMWFAVAVATFIALMTAICYATLASQYPQAGAGSAYFYAEAAFLEKESHTQFKLARIAKLIVGLAAHLYYWVYPGVMVTFMGTIIVFIVQQVNPNLLTAQWEQVACCVAFAVLVGIISFLGINGSTVTNIIINIIQIISLVLISVMAISFRTSHPQFTYAHASFGDVFGPGKFVELFFQSTIAILLVVGFESATSLAAEAKDPKKDIPRGVILSLIIQAVIFYLFEYFASCAFIGNQYAAVLDKNGANFMLIDPSKIHAAADAGAAYAGGSIVTGFAAAAVDTAPIGSFCHILGESFFGTGKGEPFELIIAVTVVLALLGTTLSCLNTAVRVSYAMGKDKELPGLFGGLHGKFNTPHNAIIILTILSAIIGGYGELKADNLIQITLISNLGTFLLYGLTCIACFIAFSHVKDANPITTKIVPIVGVLLNFGLAFGDFYFAFNTGVAATPASVMDTKIALGVSFGFMILAFVWLAVRSAAMKQPMLLPPDHKESIA